MLISRHAFPIVESALNRQAAVALIGPRQVGKTTLARLIGDQRQAHECARDGDHAGGAVNKSFEVVALVEFDTSRITFVAHSVHGTHPPVWLMWRRMTGWPVS